MSHSTANPILHYNHNFNRSHEDNAPNCRFFHSSRAYIDGYIKYNKLISLTFLNVFGYVFFVDLERPFKLRQCEKQVLKSYREIQSSFLSTKTLRASIH